MSHIANALKSRQSKAKVLELMDYIGTDAERVQELMDLVLGTESKPAIHASWVLYHLANARKADLSLHFDRAVEVLTSHPPPAVERALLKMFWHIDHWPDIHFTVLVDFMMESIVDTKSKIATQALSMEALLKHLKPYPELLQELAMIVEEGIPYGSAGYRAKARKILKAVRIS